MQTKSRAGLFFATLIISLMAYIVYWANTKPVSVVIQAGHEARVKGNTGAHSKLYTETEWNVYVANLVAKQLKDWNIDVLRIPAKVPNSGSKISAEIAISIHFDSAKRACHSGASIGYPNRDSYDFAQRWKSIYSKYFPFKWHKDNFTKNLRDYYAYSEIDAKKFLLLELGEITCEKQTKWLKPRLDKIAYLVAFAIAKELGEKIPEVSLKKIN